MPKHNAVQLLPNDVIARIAAGEVVDRPASVIKELVENSLDAGATSISVELKDAGKELIRVKDNGRGIAREDLEQLFQRHATSKIQHVQDLEHLVSMGFRGEALYSIAAVAQVHLRSQTANEEHSWEIRVHGGKRVDLAPAAAGATGTDISVSQLFFNTPARRNFLKGNTAEVNQAINTVVPYTLLHADKHFSLVHAGRALLDLKPAPSAIARAAELFNAHTKDLIETSGASPDSKIRIELILGNINVPRTRRDMQYIFVNGRPVEHRNLNFHINDVYRLIFPPGVYPAFVAKIDLDPANVDANVHPAKKEVRIKDEGRIYSLLRRLTEEALMLHGKAKVVSSSSDPTQSGDTYRNPTESGDMYRNPNSVDLNSGYGTCPPILKPNHQFQFSDTQALETVTVGAQPTQDVFRSRFAQARFIGAFMDKYLIFEESASLFLVDQHAAQERIMFERFKKQMESGKLEIQPLLTPVMVKMTVQEKILWEEMQEHLKNAGFDTSLFDEETLAVHTQPSLLKNAAHTVRTLLNGEDAGRYDHSTLARRACRASIMAGDRLAPAQANHQKTELLSCQDPFTCPHGRPTVIELTDAFLERQFLRT